MKRHTLLRTLTDVATRPWWTPLSRAAGPRPSSTREYGKDQVVMRSPARHENYTTPRFKMASAMFWKFGSPDSVADNVI